MVASTAESTAVQTKVSLAVEFQTTERSYACVVVVQCHIAAKWPTASAAVEASIALSPLKALNSANSKSISENVKLPPQAPTP